MSFINLDNREVILSFLIFCREYILHTVPFIGPGQIVGLWEGQCPYYRTPLEPLSG